MIPAQASVMTTSPKSSRSRTGELSVRTERRTQLLDVTAAIAKLVHDAGVHSGICYLYVPHTTAGIIINENADPDVAADIEAALARLVPQNAGYRHAEGNSDSHIKTALVGSFRHHLHLRRQTRARPLAGHLLLRIRRPPHPPPPRQNRPGLAHQQPLSSRTRSRFARTAVRDLLFTALGLAEVAPTRQNRRTIPEASYLSQMGLSNLASRLRRGDLATHDAFSPARRINPMRHLVIVSVLSFATLLIFALLILSPALAQQGAAGQSAGQAAGANPPRPGFEVPLVTPGPGWKACPHCENEAYKKEDRKKASVDTRPFDAHDLSGIWSGNPNDLEVNGTPLDTKSRSASHSLRTEAHGRPTKAPRRSGIRRTP